MVGQVSCHTIPHSSLCWLYNVSLPSEKHADSFLKVRTSEDFHVSSSTSSYQSSESSDQLQKQQTKGIIKTQKQREGYNQPGHKFISPSFHNDTLYIRTPLLYLFNHHWLSSALKTSRRPALSLTSAQQMHGHPPHRCQERQCYQGSLPVQEAQD